MANSMNAHGDPVHRMAIAAAGSDRSAPPPATPKPRNGPRPGAPAWPPALRGAALAITLLSGPALAWAGSGTVTAVATPFVARFTAFARVVPIAILRLRAATTGVVAGLDILPGTQITAGTMLARLTGPTADAELAGREAAVASAQAALAAASKAFGIQRQDLGLHLSTQQAVSQAQAARLAAQATLGSTQARLQAVRSELTLQAPTTGRVLTVNAADGERVIPGQIILTIEPANNLWLTAEFYGADAAAIRPGMQGRFRPAGGGPKIPVRVRSLPGVLRPGGGLVAALDATAPAPNWHSGESGSVVLDGAQESTLPAVPTRALILDRGRWWVMLHTSHGNQRQAVVPGPAQGDLTLIRHGLAPGAEVVVDNPYLEFHRDFSQTYQQPD